MKQTHDHHWAELSPDEVVLRGKSTEKLSEENPVFDVTDFNFSYFDAAEVPPQLSVYSSQYTEPIDLKILVSPNMDAVALLKVGDIVKLRVDPNIQVRYTTKYYPDDSDYIDTRKGAYGHSSILGLDLPTGDNKTNKKLRKQIRAELAKLAIANYVYLGDSNSISSPSPITPPSLPPLNTTQVAHPSVVE